MDFAEIPISVPEYFPDLIVTSYYRPTGTHASYKAIDMALHKMPYTRDRGSMYWFYYFAVVDMLWRHLRRGILRVAYPPNCPHYHLDVSESKNLAGVELIQLKDGKCTYKSHVDYDNTSGSQRIAWITKFRKEVAEPWQPPFTEELFAEVKYIFSKNTKKIRVYVNEYNGKPYIGRDDLQAKLNLAFGTGATTELIGDTLAQWGGYQNATDAKQQLITQNPWFWLAIATPVAFGVYSLAKEKAFWDMANRKK